MKAKAAVYRMTEDQIDIAAICKSGELLKQGELVAFPTETVYGLGGNALDPEASRKIYAAKGRPSDNPLIVHIADMDDLSKITKIIPKGAFLAAERFWPGPLTMIFEKSDLVPYETTGGLDSVAVRFPNHVIAQELILAGGGFIAAPSANTSGRPSPTTAAHVEEDLGNQIAAIIDGGPVEIGLESTIIDFTEEVPVILRPGYITKEMLESVIGEVRLDPALLKRSDGIKPKAPGMKYRHYAPKADLYIVKGEEASVVKMINQLSLEEEKKGGVAGIIGTEETVGQYTSGIVKCIGSRKEEESIAKHLYEVLREFDSSGASVIFSESFDTPVMGQAIMNRLLKAAGHKILYSEENAK